jgi:protein-S-isoprenylcysteine O-methyltransferase Ste14
MRNPIRLKNLRLRFLPFYAVGVLLVVVTNVEWQTYCLGVPPIVAGLVLRAWGTGHLIKNDRFIVTGPYAHVRHPLYLGTILVGVGFSLMFGGWTSLAAMCAVLPWFSLLYFPRKERLESARLESLYGPVFRSYREQVPALLPRLRPWKPNSADFEQFETRLHWTFACYDNNNELGTLLAVLVGMMALGARAALA